MAVDPARALIVGLDLGMLSGRLRDLRRRARSSEDEAPE